MPTLDELLLEAWSDYENIHLDFLKIDDVDDAFRAGFEYGMRAQAVSKKRPPLPVHTDWEDKNWVLLNYYDEDDRCFDLMYAITPRIWPQASIDEKIVLQDEYFSFRYPGVYLLESVWKGLDGQQQEDILAFIEGWEAKK